MDIELKVILRDSISKWLNKICEHDKRKCTYSPDDLIENMTKAAETVYDQNDETQEWLEINGYIKD